MSLRTNFLFLVVISVVYSQSPAPSPSPSASDTSSSGASGSQCGPKRVVGVVTNTGGQPSIQCVLIDCIFASNSTGDCKSYSSSSCSDSEYVTGVQVSGTVQQRCCSFPALKTAKKGLTTFLRKGDSSSYSPIKSDGSPAPNSTFNSTNNATIDQNRYIDVVQNIESLGEGMYLVHTRRYKCNLPPPDVQNFDISKLFGSGVQKVTDIKDDKGNTIAPVFACFHHNSTVLTPNGMVTMSELSTSKQVLSLENGGISAFKSILYWLHRDPYQETDFVVLETEFGHRLTLTFDHLMFKVPCTMNPWEFNSRAQELITLAGEMQVGDCVLSQVEQNQIKVARVEKVSSVRDRGIYAPVTANGVVVVDGVVASCYVKAKDQNLLKTVFHKTANILHYLSRFLPLPDPHAWEHITDVPQLVNFVIEQMYNLAPTSLFN